MTVDNTPFSSTLLHVKLLFLCDFVQEAEKHAEAQAAVCEICTAKNVDRSFVDHFGVAVCWSCKKADVTDNYKLVSKTTARSDFLLTEKDFEGEQVVCCSRFMGQPRLNTHRLGVHWKAKSKRLFCRGSDEVVHAAAGMKTWKASTSEKYLLSPPQSQALELALARHGSMEALQEEVFCSCIAASCLSCDGWYVFTSVRNWNGQWHDLKAPARVLGRIRSERVMAAMGQCWVVAVFSA
jgi:hypothetical protein